MSAYEQLRRLVGRPGRAEYGTVVAVGPVLRVSTRTGVLTGGLQSGDVTPYRIGDRVRVVDGRVIGRVNATAEVYVL